MKQPLSFLNTPDNVPDFASLSASLRHIQLYHNANAPDGDVFWTHSDGT